MRNPHAKVSPSLSKGQGVEDGRVTLGKNEQGPLGSTLVLKTFELIRAEGFKVLLNRTDRKEFWFMKPRSVVQSERIF